MKSRHKTRVLIFSIIISLILIVTAACTNMPSKNDTYKLTFMDGEKIHQVFEQKSGTDIEDLQLPLKTGYTFTGWLDDNSEPFTPDKMPAKNLVVYAQYDANTYNITFVLGEDAKGALSDIAAKYDENINLPAAGATSSEGYPIFGYTDLSGSDDVKWPAGSPAKNLASEQNATVTLYVIYMNAGQVGDLALIKEDGVVTGYTGAAKTLILPDDCTAIAPGAFANAAFLRTVIIPDTYTEIGFGAFEGCDNLEKLTVPFIGGSADEDNYLAYIFGAAHYTDNNFTYELTLIKDDDGNITSTEIDMSTLSGVFYIPRSLRVVILNAPIKEFGEGAFYYAYGLEKVILYTYETEEGSDEYEYTVEKVGAHAFEGCHTFGLDTVIRATVTMEWFRTIKEFGEAAFKGIITAGSMYATQLANVGELTAAEVIGDEAFRNCSRIYNLSFGENLVSIGKNAFTGNVFMQKAIIPNSVVTIGDEAFSYCDYLASVEIGTGVRSIGKSAFSPIIGLTEVIFRGNTAISIGDSAFSGVIMTDDGYMLDPTGDCNDGLVFYFESETAKTSISPAISGYINAGKSLLIDNGYGLRYNLGGSAYAFTVEFGKGHTLTLNDPYSRAGFGLPYMIGTWTKVGTEDLYYDEDIFLVSFMAGMFNFYAKLIITHSGYYTHYYRYLIPSIQLQQLSDPTYEKYMSEGFTDAVSFGNESTGWCLKESIFGQITVIKDGQMIALGEDVNGVTLEEESYSAQGGIWHTYMKSHLPRTLVYRQTNIYFEPILAYYFTYVPTENDDRENLKFYGSLLLDETKSDLGEYGNILIGNYATSDGGLELYIDEATHSLKISGTTRDGKEIDFDSTFTSSSTYGDGAIEGDKIVYNNYVVNNITADVDGEQKTVTVTLKDFHLNVEDPVDSRFVHMYLVCDIVVDGQVYRLYNEKNTNRQESFNLRSDGTKRDHYTLILYHQTVEIKYEDGSSIGADYYPGYVEYVDGTTHKYGRMKNDFINEKFHYVFEFTDGETVNALVTDGELNIFEAPYGSSTRTYVPYYEIEEDVTFTKDNISIWMDGYGNGKYYEDGVEKWSGKYMLASGSAVANVFLTEYLYYPLMEYKLTGPSGQIVYFAPNFYDSYDGTMKKGDMLMPDENRNKTYASIVKTAEGKELYSAALACSGYSIAYLYILTAQDGQTVPIEMATVFAPGVAVVTYEEIGKVNGFSKILIKDRYNEGFFTCLLADNVVYDTGTTKYYEMVIDEDYYLWWAEKTAVQVTGSLEMDVYSYPRLTAREEMGRYTSVNGYVLDLDGKGGAILYNNLGSAEETDIIATGTFTSFDEKLLQSTRFPAEVKLKFTGSDEEFTFNGNILINSGVLEINIEIADGINASGFAKATAVKGEYSSGQDKVILYNDGRACYYAGGIFDFGIYSEYKANPDPVNALDSTVIEGDNLYSLKVSTRKLVVSVNDENNSFVLKGSYATRSFATGCYTAEAYMEYTEGGYYKDDAGQIIEFDKKHMYGYDLNAVDGELYLFVRNEYMLQKTYIMMFSEADKANGETDYYKYQTHDALKWTLYEDGEFIFEFNFHGFMIMNREGWYYEVGEGEEKECYMVLRQYTTVITKYTLVSDYPDAELDKDN